MQPGRFLSNDVLLTGPPKPLLCIPFTTFSLPALLLVDNSHPRLSTYKLHLTAIISISLKAGRVRRDRPKVKGIVNYRHNNSLHTKPSVYLSQVKFKITGQDIFWQENIYILRLQSKFPTKVYITITKIGLCKPVYTVCVHAVLGLLPQTPAVTPVRFPIHLWAAMCFSSVPCIPFPTPTPSFSF